jgi:hypothetical protein
MERKDFIYKGVKFSFSIVESNGKQAIRVNFIENQKYMRKTFQGKDESFAVAWAKNYVDSKNIGIDRFQDISPQILADLQNALKYLPKGESLESAVKRSVEYSSKISIQKAAREFIITKERNYRTIGHITHCKSTLNRFAAKFADFRDCQPSCISKYLAGVGAIKTIQNHAGIIKDFFRFCMRRDYISSNPFDKLAPEDYGAAGSSDYIPEISSVEQTREFLAYIYVCKPKFLKFYILALFGGVRVSECPRIRPEYIDYTRREISFPKKIVKGKIKNFLVGNYPAVLFDWLDTLKTAPIIRPNADARRFFGKIFNLPANFARHNFATYHLSLYRDAHKTAKLTRHLNVRTLEEHYISNMVKTHIARQYFALKPAYIAEYAQKNAEKISEYSERVGYYYRQNRRKKSDRKRAEKAEIKKDVV